MICKIKHGQDFQGCLDYITGKYDKDKKAKVIMHSEGIPLLDTRLLPKSLRHTPQRGATIYADLWDTMLTPSTRRTATE